MNLSSVVCNLSSAAPWLSAIGYWLLAIRERASGEFARPMTFDVLEFVTLLITGFTSCAEFGSYAFVHPVIRRLPPEHHVFVEKGLLRTFGRVMPVLMALCPVLSIAYATQASAGLGVSAGIRWMSAIVFVAALISTILLNVPINLATRRWNPQNPPQKWKEIRNRWELFQGIRSWLLLTGFGLLCLAVAAGE